MRLDVEGLRGISVVTVVAFHAGIAGFSGGFVGVDIFFVISGFLITGLLLKEAETNGAITLRAFWARRAARLIPLLAVAVIGTLAAVLALRSALQWTSASRDAVGGLLFVDNILFAREGRPYFDAAPSPFLHLWSLGVEEQFYIAWPIAVAIVLRLRRLGARSAVMGLAALTTVVSFALGVIMTNRQSPWAFYSPATRAWEFGVGALLAAAGQNRLTRWPTVRRLVGLGLIAVAVVRLDALTAFPGFAALLPVVGAALVLSVDDRTSPVSRGLGNPALVWLGGLSYGWYLLHWPAIVLTSTSGEPASRIQSVLAATVALLGAWALGKAVERPARAWLRAKGPALVLAVSVASLGVAGATAMGVRQFAHKETRDPFLQHLVRVRDARSESGGIACSQMDLSPNVQECVGGDSAGKPLILLVGDSHAGEWAPAIEAAAKQVGARLVVRAYGGCPVYDVLVRRTGFSNASQSCLAVRRRTEEVLNGTNPAVVIVANGDYSQRLLRSEAGGLLSKADAAAAYESGWAQFASLVESRSARLMVVQDNPVQDREPIECLARERSASKCSVDRAKAVPSVEARNRQEFEALTKVTPTVAVSPIDWICDEKKCLVERDGLVVYSDNSHLSREFVLAHTSDFAAALRSIIG